MNVGSSLSTALLFVVFDSDAVLGGNEIVTDELKSPVSVVDSGSVPEDDWLCTDKATSLLVSMNESSSVLGDDKLKTEEPTLLLVSILDSNSVLSDIELRTEELTSLRVSILNSKPVLGDTKLRTEELTSLRISIVDSSSVLGGDEVRTEELMSLVVRKSSSLMEVLRTSEPDEETALRGESGMSIGVVTGAGIISLLGIEAEVSNSLLSPCIELTRAGLEVE